MVEIIKKLEMINMEKPGVENFKSIKPESDISLMDAKTYVDELFSENSEQQDTFHTSYEDRMKYTPNDGERGKWEGKPGESKFIPSQETESGQLSKEKLSERGIDGIEYKNGEPDFSPVSEATVKIDKMTENRHDYFDANGDKQQGNFTQADFKCADMWNEIGRDNRNDWTPQEVRDWRKENNYSWHERCDTKTMDMVSQDIHGFFNHSGGVFECKVRDNAIGGGFDE